MNPVLLLTVKSTARPRLASGHPWIYANELVRPPRTAEPGGLVDVQTNRGILIGRGYYNPRSVIAVRLLAREAVEIDQAFFRRAIADAQALRDRVASGEDAYRAVFGEADGLPGLIVDRYGPVLVAQILTAGMDRMTDAIVTALVDRYQPAAIVARNDASSRKLEGLAVEKRLLYGTLPAELLITKDGLRFAVDVWEGQKTGFSWTSRPITARSRVGHGRTRPRRVLLRGRVGLARVAPRRRKRAGTRCLREGPGHSQANASCNGLGERVSTGASTCSDELRKLLAAGARHELIILDPRFRQNAKRQSRRAARL
jgi:23S rRNA (cytosine1962-C5)-methyltransferase